MAKVIAPRAPATASTAVIQDPATRAVVQTIKEAVDATAASYVTEAEIKEMAGEVVVTGLKAVFSGDPIPGNIRASVEAIANALSAAVRQTEVYAELDQRIDTVGLDITTVGSGLATEITNRADSEDALVSTINSMWGAIGVAGALTQTGSSIAINWNATQASQWNQLQVEVFGTGGNTIRAALAEEASLRVGLEGDIAATWTVRVDANGYVAGIGLGVEGGPSGTTSTFLVRADKFAVIAPGYSNYIPFAIGPAGMALQNTSVGWSLVGGAGKPADNATVGATFGVNISGQITPGNITTYIANAAIQNAQIADLAVGTAQIADAAIDTLKVASESVTISRVSTGTVPENSVSSSVWRSVTTLSLTERQYIAAVTILIRLNPSINLTRGAYADLPGTFRIRRTDDNAVISTFKPQYAMAEASPGSGTFNPSAIPINTSVVDPAVPVGSGTLTYALEYLNTSSDSSGGMAPADYVGYGTFAMTFLATLR